MCVSHIEYRNLLALETAKNEPRLQRPVRGSMEAWRPGLASPGGLVRIRAEC